MKLFVFSLLSKKTGEAQLFQQEQLDVNLDTIQDSNDLLNNLDNQQQKQCINIDSTDLLNSNTESLETSVINNTQQDQLQGEH